MTTTHLLLLALGLALLFAAHAKNAPTFVSAAISTMWTLTVTGAAPGFVLAVVANTVHPLAGITAAFATGAAGVAVGFAATEKPNVVYVAVA